MTSSQRTARIVLVLTIITAALTAALPHLDALPADYRFVGAIVPGLLSVIGAVKLALSQSLMPGHVSIPVETARKAGVAKKQTKTHEEEG
jgi:hypothetical protein